MRSADGRAHRSAGTQHVHHEPARLHRRQYPHALHRLSHVTFWEPLPAIDSSKLKVVAALPTSSLNEGRTGGDHLFAGLTAA